jgi:hypothetical protein
MGCDAADNYECYRSVQAKYPEAKKIYVPVGIKYTFVVRDKDGKVYFVRTMKLFNTDISSTEMLWDYKEAQ